jgi:hypothetical protein
MLAVPVEALTQLIGQASRHKFGPRKVAQLRAAAEQSIGVQRGLVGIRIGIRSLLDQLDAFRPIRKALEEQIAALAQQLPDYLLTLPGTSPNYIVSLFGETDPPMFRKINTTAWKCCEKAT